MFHSQILSAREKALAIIGGVLLIVLVVVGYARTNAQGTAGTTSDQTSSPTSTATPSETPQSSSPDDVKNMQRSLADQQSYLKNLRREVEDIKREVKGLDTSAVDGYLSKFEACLNTMQSAVGTPDFWSRQQDCNDPSRSVNDELADNLRPKRQCEEFKSNVKNRRDELKRNVDQQIKDIKRNDKTTDTSGLEKQRADLDALITKLETTVAVCNADSTSDANSLQRDIDDAFRDWYDAANELSNKANQARQTSENQRDFEKNIKRQCEKDLARELKSFEKEFARLQKAGTVPQEVQAGYNNVNEMYKKICVTAIQTMQQALTSGDADTFNDARNDFNNSTRDFWDALNEARNFSNTQQQAKDVTREIAQREKDFVQMKKEYERAVKKVGKEIPDVKAILDSIEKLFTEAKTAVQTDPQSWWNDYQQQINDLQNEFWNSQQKVQSLGDVQRWLKDISKEVKFREKDLANIRRDKGMEKEVVTVLEGILSSMKELTAKATELAGSDPESAHDALQSMDDLRFQWDDAMRSVSERHQMTFDIGQVKREVEFAIQKVAEMLRNGKISQEEASACLDFAKSVQQKLGQLNSGSNPEEFFQELDEQGKQMCPFLEESAPPPDRAYYENFIGQNVAGLDKGIAADVLEKISQDIVSKVMQRLLADPSSIQNLLQSAGKNHTDTAAGALEAVTSFYDESSQRDVLAKKAEILDLTNKLEDLRLQRLKVKVKIAQAKLDKLQSIQNEISGYNFYGNAGDQIRTNIESFISQTESQGLSSDQIQAGIDQLGAQKDAAIQSSKEEKLRNGYIPFFDTDDNSWYTKYVAPLAKQGIVRGKGDGRNFDPGAQVTVAEILTMAFRVSGDQETDGASALCGGKYANHWANKFVSWAESRNLSIVSQCTDINRPALRWEVAQVLLEAKNGQVETSNESCFSDVNPSSQTVNSVVCSAQNTGIMKGTNGLSNAFKNIIRAEAATMVKQAGEKLFGIQFESGPSGGNRIQEKQETSSATSQRSRCWYDEQCTDMVSSQLVSEDECRDALGGKGFGPDENNCKAL